MTAQLVAGLMCLTLAVAAAWNDDHQYHWAALALAWTSGWALAFYRATRDLLKP